MAPPPKAGMSDSKSPKLPRRLKTPEPRQVRFDPEGAVPSSPSCMSTGPAATQFTTANSPRGGLSSLSSLNSVNKDASVNSSKELDREPASTAPASFPHVGIAPNAHLQWHTAANPSLSLGHQLPGTLTYSNTTAIPNQQQQFQFLPSLQQQQQQQQQLLSCAPATNPIVFPPAQQPPSSVTYIGLQHQPAQTQLQPQPQIMGDYQNAAPPSQGVHFQPPVPDTTFGPIPHVYVPRFDHGLVAGTQFPGVQQPAAGFIQPQPAQSGFVVAQQPYYVQQPAVMGQQPILMNPQPTFIPQAQQIATLPAVGLASGAAIPGGIPVVAGNNGLNVPEVAGVGRTAGEEQLRQIMFAHKNRLYEPQEFKPADDDPGRWYWLREVDGNWTQRDRHTLDHLGDIRWYVTDEGWFYAVKLA
ncbi:hypothetical protein BGZ63DRAFT_425800 [Mariannaea sp. PMI_226]|nr:hypothetical protein BGZ63DRAFT_425800 [Mariannaea sp. PMI_226]